jgi:hypothetical protein
LIFFEKLIHKSLCKFRRESHFVSRLSFIKEVSSTLQETEY